MNAYLKIEHAAIISATSFLGACFIVLRRVHENRIVGTPGDHSSDVYWPINLIFEYFSEAGQRFFNFLYNLLVPFFRKIVCNVASSLHKITYNASRKFLQISDMVKGKGALKKNSGTTSLFLRDIAEYKKNLNEK